MILMWVLGAVLLAGTAAALRWSNTEYREWAPPADSESELFTWQQAVRIYLRGVGIWLVAGVWAGMAVTGPAMRLIMRLLAATAGDTAQGVVTEAEQIVGQISFGETVGLLFFGGLFPGLLSAFAYLVVRRWLPRGWVGGVLFGLAHLLIAATRVDPLRAANPDFDIVGPGWLSVLTFGAATVLHGVAVVAFANRYSRELPPGEGRAARVKALLPLIPAALVLVPGAILLVFVVLIGMIAVGGLQVPPLRRLLKSARALLVGRVVAIAVLVIAAPTAVRDLVDIATRRS